MNLTVLLFQLVFQLLNVLVLHFNLLLLFFQQVLHLHRLVLTTVQGLYFLLSRFGSCYAVALLKLNLVVFKRWMVVQGSSLLVRMPHKKWGRVHSTFLNCVCGKHMPVGMVGDILLNFFRLCPSTVTCQRLVQALSRFVRLPRSSGEKKILTWEIFDVIMYLISEIIKHCCISFLITLSLSNEDLTFALAFESNILHLQVQKFIYSKTGIIEDLK